MPTVTVLMTVYNGLPYLAEAIESVLGQTYSDFEFLIIDDASSDKSVKCIRSYRDPRIRLLVNDRNLGQVSSLNRGLAEARGTFVARMDQDDVSLAGRLAKQVDVMIRQPEVSLVGTWGHCINSEGRRTWEWRPKMDSLGEFLGSLLIGRSLLLHPSVMFRAEVAAALGRYDPSYAPAEDYEFWTRFALRGYQARIIPRPLVCFRVHGKAQTSARSLVQRSNHRRAHQSMVSAFCDSPMSHKVAVLLRMEPEFWQLCRSKTEILAVLDGLDQMLGQVGLSLRLSQAELSRIRGVVLSWIGPGAAVCRRLRGAPSAMFYPIFIALSPCLVPEVLPWARRGIDALRRLRCFLRRGCNMQTLPRYEDAPRAIAKL
jgi:GT2 family glycosyltransferase